MGFFKGYGDHKLGLEHSVLALLSQFVFVSCPSEGHGKRESVSDRVSSCSIGSE